MKRQERGTPETARITRIGTWAVAGSVLATGTLLSYGVSAQEVLPVPPAPFKGQIGLSVKDSKSDFPKPVEAPKRAPNVVVIMLDGDGIGRGGTGTIFVNGTKVAQGRIDNTQGYMISLDEGADVGQDGETPVVEDYGIPYPYTFTGKIDKVTVDVKKVEKAGQLEQDKLRQTTMKRALAE